MADTPLAVRNLVQADTITDLHIHGPVRLHDFASAPLKIGRIPGLAAARHERQADRDLQELFDSGPEAPVCQVLSGMAGAGKTQIAAAYAQGQWAAGAVDLVVWVDADSRESITARFAQAAAKVCGADASDADQAAEEFVNWLDRPNGPRWLIVLDNLTDPEHLSELRLPETAHCRTVVTTQARNDALEGWRRTRIDVGLFSPKESAAYLAERLRGDARVMESAAALARDLGFLPLGLAQAAAYIRDQPGLTCAAYRELLADRTNTLGNLSPEAYPDGYGKPLSAAWSLALEAADKRAPQVLGTRVMQVLSLLDTANIPTGLLRSKPVSALLAAPGPTEAKEPKSSAGLSRQELDEVLRRLHLYNLIELDHDVVRVHSLVQRHVRDQMPRAARTPTARATATGLHDAGPGIDDFERLRAHCSNILALLHNTGLDLIHPNFHDVLFQAGDVLGHIGQPRAAHTYFKLLLERARSCFNPLSEECLLLRFKSALWQRRSGDTAGAVDTLERLIDDLPRKADPTYPLVFVSRLRLAELRAFTGDRSTAIAELEQLLEQQRGSRDCRAVDELETRAALAKIRGESGDAVSAAAELHALHHQHHLLRGRDHPMTFAFHRNLARWLCEIGDFDGGIYELTNLLEYQEDRLGLDHRETMLTRARLARSYEETQHWKEARTLYKALLADQSRLYGDDHPETLRTRLSLASVLRMHDAASATAETELVLDLALKRSDPDHPFVLEIRGRVAYYLATSRGIPAALEAYESLVPDLMRVHGPTDRRTLTARADLARLRGKAGDHGRAAQELESLLQEHIQTFSERDRSTLAIWGSFARQLGELGDPERALSELQRVLEHQLELFPASHRDVAITRHGIARWLRESENLEDAVAELERLLAAQLNKFNDDHPQVKITRRLLAEYRVEAAVNAYAGEPLNLLADRLRRLPEDDPEATLMRHHLARRLHEEGDHLGAVAELEVLRLDLLRKLTRGNRRLRATKVELDEYRTLAGFREDAGQDELRTHIQSATAQLGDTHRFVFILKRRLASRRRKDESAAAVISELQQLLEDQKAALGVDHEDLSWTREVLADCHSINGDVRSAVDLRTELLEHQRRVLGHRDPETLYTQDQLARGLAQLGDAAGAAELLGDLIEAYEDGAIRESARERKRLSRFRFRHSMLLSTMGRHEEAMARLEALVAEYADRGDEHHAVRTRGALAEVRASAGALDTALEELDALVEEVSSRPVGDLLVVDARVSRARVHGMAGDPGRAVRELLVLQEECRALLGPETKRMQMIRDELDRWRGN